MAKLPSPEENARKVLEIYAHFGTRPGEGLLTQNFIAAGIEKGMRNSDLADGLEYGSAQEWFKEGKNGFMILTETGYAEI